MKRYTRRQKKEAFDLLASRTISPEIAFQFLGAMQAHAKFEIAGEKTTTVSAALAQFVQTHEIRNLPPK